MNCGLYMIRNSATGDFYVGSSQRLATRMSDHRTMLRRRTHDNIHLQRSFDKHGEAAFSFRVIAILERTERLTSEQRLLDRCVGKPNCYNIGVSALSGTSGRKMSPEFCARLSAAKKGKPGHPVSAEARAKIGAANRGKPNAWKGKTRPAETRAKMSAWQIGRVLTEEHKEKVRQANIGKRQSAETIEKRAAKQRGRRHPPLSAESRQRIKEAARRRKPRRAA